MRIISKVRDYYDSGAAFGVDMNTVFERMPYALGKEHPLYNILGHLAHSWNRPKRFQYNTTPQLTGRFRKLDSIDWEYEGIRVTVADKSYHGLIVTKYIRGGFVSSDPKYRVLKYFWKEEDLEKFLKEHIPENCFDMATALGYINNPFYISKVSDSIQKIMLDNGIVIVSGDPKYAHTVSLTINGSDLGLYGLQKLVDPTMMFSAIDQWVSLMDDPSRKMIEIADKDKMSKHGMDKTSFRGPGNKRKMKV